MKERGTGGGKNDTSSEVFSTEWGKILSREYRKILVRKSFYIKIIGLNLLKEGLHLSCFLLNFANFLQASYSAIHL